MDNPPATPPPSPEQPGPAPNAAPSPAPTTAPAPAPAASAPTAPQLPPRRGLFGGSGAPRDSVRSNVRMSGVMMILVGALMAWQLFQVASIADHVWSDAEANQYADKPGGGVNLDVIGTVPANVTVLSLNGTILFSGPTNATGHLQTPPKTLAVNVRVAVGNQTWTRKVISYEQLETPLKINTASDPPTQSAWVQPDLSYLHWFWIGVVAFGLTALGGVAAAMLRGATFAFAMSILFLAGAAFLLLQAQTFTFILFAAMAAFSVWAIRKGRDRFTALEIAGLKL